MAEGGGRRSTSRCADKLALLVAADLTVPPFLQSQQQCGGAAAHRAPYQQSFNYSLPPGTRTIQALMASQSCLLELFSFLLISQLPLFHISTLSVRVPRVFFLSSPHFSNLNSLLVSSPPLSDKARGGQRRGGLFIFSLLILFHLSPHDTERLPFRVSSLFSRGVGENAWLTPFYSVYAKVP